jgi:hypothetical protein
VLGFKGRSGQTKTSGKEFADQSGVSHNLCLVAPKPFSKWYKYDQAASDK